MRRLWKSDTRVAMQLHDRRRLLCKLLTHLMRQRQGGYPLRHALLLVGGGVRDGERVERAPVRASVAQPARRAAHAAAEGGETIKKNQ